MYDAFGVNQGGANSPDMFIDFLADMGEYLTKSCGFVISDKLLLMHLLWADDLILMSDIEEGLQKQLDNLFRYYTDWQLIVNTLKTKCMVFNQINKVVDFHFNNAQIEKVDKYKYVGVIFSSIGPVFNLNVERLIISANRAMYKVRSYCRCFGQFPPVTAPNLYNSLVDQYLHMVVKFGFH